ncbi:glucan biosynthesis protein G [Methylolobus aquaticus]|nr:glucan biosynthesis protein G [Methylolobus aquaticus]
MNTSHSDHSRVVRTLLVGFVLLFVHPAHAEPAAPVPFDFAAVASKARALAAKPYVRDDGGLPEQFAKLDYDAYQEIRFKSDRALWRGEGLQFQLQLFHRGNMFRDRVAINVVDQGTPTRIAYSPELFDFGAARPPAPLPPDLGFAGVKIDYPLRRDGSFEDVAIFLGASYFRAAGLGQIYGLSARALAVDTGLPKAEEFPIFREFWIAKPAQEAGALTIYALLDSPSVSGAYRFDLKPGYQLTVDVQSRLFFRKPVDRLGMAPLTSMFFHGENTDRFMDDFRPEVHDSDGLLMARSNGEWLWRPLNNPRQLRISVFREENPVGFGLLKRDRNPDHYQDFGASYQLRPSVWVEARGEWGRGAVYLIEIPSDAEKYDNIVAFWVPDAPIKEGSELAFDYRLHFLLDESMAPQNGRVVATRVSASPGKSDRPRRHFVVDFAGEALGRLSPQARLVADVGSSSGQIGKLSVEKNDALGIWRVSFDLEREEDQDPVELRAVLKAGADVLSETWIYQWSAR